MTMNKRYDTAPHRWEASVITCISDERVHMILANSNDSRDVATTLARKRPPRYS